MEPFPNQPGNQSVPLVIAGPDSENEESGFDFWGVLSRRKWLVFLGLVVGMGLGGLYHAQTATIFKSEAKVKIEPKDPVTFQLPNGVSLPGAADLMMRHDQLIGQFNIVKQTLSQQDLFRLPSLSDLSEEDAVLEIMKNLDIAQNNEEPTLYNIVFYSSNPEDAQSILNNLLVTYEEDLEAQYAKTSDEIKIIFEEIRDVYSDKYEGLQRELEAIYAVHNAPIVAYGDLSIHQIRLKELGQILQEQKSERASLAADRERVMTALAGTPEEIEACLWNHYQLKLITEVEKEERYENKDDVDFQADRAIHELEMQKLEASNRLGPGSRQIKALDASIEGWKKFKSSYSTIDEPGPTGPDPDEILRRHVLSLNERITDLESGIQINVGDLNLHTEKAQKIANADRAVDRIKIQMKDLNEIVQIAKGKLIDFDSEKEGQNSRKRQEGFRVHTLMDATYGEEVWPILPVILGVGGLLGCLIGFGLGCLVELADKTFHNPDQIMKQLQVPLIGHIPVITSSKRYLIENSSIDPIVCTYHRPKSQVAEAFRAVRTALFFNVQGKQHSVIQVTSPTPGDGKSTLAANLAVSIAHSGKRVLLVDADMRRPRQHTTFGISAKKGFATVLSGDSEWRDVVMNCDEIEGLSILPCGSKPQNPAELSSSPQVKVLIEEMRIEFDFVIIDTPPLLAVTDPCPIAARVDGVLLCLRIKKNVRVSAERATEMINNLGASCIGLVVNGVGAQSGYGSQYTYGAYGAGYSYNGYGYGYGYGNSSGKYYEQDKRGRKVEPQPKRLENHPVGSGDANPKA